MYAHSEWSHTNIGAYSDRRRRKLVNSNNVLPGASERASDQAVCVIWSCVCAGLFDGLSPGGDLRQTSTNTPTDDLHTRLTNDEWLHCCHAVAVNHGALAQVPECRHGLGVALTITTPRVRPRRLLGSSLGPVRLRNAQTRRPVECLHFIVSFQNTGV